MIKMNDAINEEVRLNLGSGYDIKKGYINCDRNKDKGADVSLDLEEPLPFGSELAVEILLKHTLEHITNRGELFEDCIRVLKKGGELCIVLPTYGFNQLGHKSFFHTPQLIKSQTKSYSVDRKKLDYLPQNKYKLELISFKGKRRSLKAFILLCGSRFIYWVMSFLYSEYETKVRKK